MASNINAAVPPFGNATTAGVRENFATAKAEIEALQSGRFDSGLVLKETPGVGFKVNETLPSYPWHDIIGQIYPKDSGPGSPALSSFRGGNFRALFYSVNDNGEGIYHIPHDYVPGTDLFIHMHWSHNGTAISGSLVLGLNLSYAKGHQQATFGAEVAATLTVETPSIVVTPRYQHRVDELQITSSTPSASQINSNLIEPDGLLLVHFNTVQIPVITGGIPNEPCYFTMDVHYQSTGIGTIQKSPDFWTP
jgi:hypothetical protein